MLSALKRYLQLKRKSDNLSRQRDDFLIYAVFMGILQDVVFWKKTWLSVTCLLLFNILFFMGSYQETKFLAILFYMLIVAVCADGVEMWLKNKHRTSFLRKLASSNSNQLDAIMSNFNQWTKLQWNNYVNLRDTNHTKGFLMVNVVLTIVFIVGKYLGGVIVVYLVIMLLTTLHITAPVFSKIFQKIQQIAESDGDIDSLIPEVTDRDLHILSVEPIDYPIDENQSQDYWKPEDQLPGEDVSDSSGSSSSLVTNLSMEKLHKMDEGVESSDSSDDEYIPLVPHKEQLQSTLEVQPAGTWSSSALNTLYNLTGSITSMVYTADTKRLNAVARADSSDGFEFIDRDDL